MALTQQDHLAAAKAQLSRKRDEFLAKARELEEQMRTLDEIARSLGTPMAEAIGAPLAPRGFVPVRTRHPLQDNLDRYIEEEVRGKGKSRFSPAEAKSYIEGLGHGGRWLYTTVYEALKKRVADTKAGKVEGKRRLWKDGEQFAVENPRR